MSDNNMNDNYNPMPMNSKSFINSTDFYTKSLLNLKKDNINNQYLSRHFYKIPENNQDNFAKSLFPNTSACRDTGYLCRVEENSSRTLNRLSFDKNKFQSQYLNLNKSMKDKIIDIVSDNVPNDNVPADEQENKIIS